jgi:hypothetical protein
LVKYLRQGNTRKRVCEMLGLGYATLMSWLKLGRESSAPEHAVYRELLDNIIKAEAWSIARDVNLIKRAARKSWFAAAWMLERKLPEEFGRDSYKMKELERLVRELEKRVTDNETKGPPDTPLTSPD